jgi:hypothetical protein
MRNSRGALASRPVGAVSESHGNPAPAGHPGRYARRVADSAIQFFRSFGAVVAGRKRAIDFHVVQDEFLGVPLVRNIYGTTVSLSKVNRGRYRPYAVQHCPCGNVAWFYDQKMDLVQFLDTRLGACADEVKLDAQCFARCLI